eukprot:CAMPEP_0171122232 /NCGR_PEP_ID=MMETSP0766_2-20121228/104562_1 /TAXON_ID=439317 /ORGANISM="Gambierdiscus australes, Strain CAWD 149" /LENGTH=69 /DNA_ID=CAMNT_0011585065 /DNA_START=253 /DNA_END=462 /DNA_ORIENTATION=+
MAAARVRSSLPSALSNVSAGRLGFLRLVLDDKVRRFVRKILRQRPHLKYMGTKTDMGNMKNTAVLNALA